MPQELMVLILAGLAILLGLALAVLLGLVERRDRPERQERPELLDPREQVKETAAQKAQADLEQLITRAKDMEKADRKGKNK